MAMGQGRQFLGPTHGGWQGVPPALNPLSVVGERPVATTETAFEKLKTLVRAAELLSAVGVEAEVIDVQTLLPFDRDQSISESLKKTNRIVFVDEDVPGGATAYMMQEVLETQGGYVWLDSEPRTVTGQPHRPAYGTDGDYFSKPNRETIFEAIYVLMRETDPGRFPEL